MSHDNVHLIDWCSASLSHDEYFDGDGTHLTAEAAVIYNQLIFDSVKSFLPAHENVDAAASNEAVSDGANIGDESTENRA